MTDYAGVRRTGRIGAVLVAAASLVVAASLAACGSSGAQLAPRVAPTDVAPQPVGVQDPAELPEESETGPGDCDPLASYRPGSDQPTVTPGSTMDEIVERGRLVVGVAQNTFLFGYRDPFTGQLAGFDVDLAREIAGALFGDPERIQFQAVSSGERIPVLENNEVDIVISTMTMNCERWESVAFSTEYYSAGQKVLVLAAAESEGIEGIDDLGGQKVCAAAGSTSIRNIADAPSEPIPVAVPDWTDCLVMLQQGQVDAISTDDTILAGLAAQDPNARVVGERFSEEPYGIAMNRSNLDLVRYVNAVLEQLRTDGTWAEIYQRWLGDLGEQTPDPPPARYQD
jgi:polar amino acid transport system substrate-binding protein